MSIVIQIVQCQEVFSSLNIADAQNDDWMHKLFDHEAFSGIVSTKCEQLRLEQNPSKSIDSEEEGYSAILDSWYAYIASEIERTQNGKSGACEPASTTNSEEVFEPLKRINNAGPPKRFRRRGNMWDSITSSMVKHTKHAELDTAK